VSGAGTCHVVENLTTWVWLGRVWPRLRRDLLQQNASATHLYYVEATRLAECIASLMCRRASVQVSRLEFEASHIFDASGTLVWLRTYYRDLEEVSRLIAGDSCFPAPRRAEDGPDHRLMFLRKTSLLVPPVFTGSGVWRGVYLVQTCVWLASRAAGSARSVVLWLDNHAWFRPMQRYAAATGVVLQPCGRAYHPLPIMRALVGRDLRSILGRLSRAGKSSLVRSQQRPPAASATKIVLQYNGQFNLSAPHLHSDFFFWQQSSLQGRNLVTLFASPNDPLDDARRVELERHGMRGVALRSTARTLPSPVFAKTALLKNIGRAAVSASLIGVKPQRAWVAAHGHVFESGVSYWLQLLEHCDAKVFLTWYKYTPDHCVIAEAMRRRGGLFAVYQRSYEGNASAQTAVAADIAFGFSRHGEMIERESGSVIGCYVITGYLGDHRFDLVKSAANAIRSALTSRGARFIVAFFDEGSFADARWGIGSERTRANYTALLERVLTDTSLGLVLKPKTPHTLRARLGPVAELLTRALETGRCHILEGGLVQGSIPPAQAALASDIAIHESISAATAAIEAALAGVRTLIMDHDGWKMSPLYRLGEGSVIFDKWQDVWYAIDDFRRGNAANLGDWTHRLDEIDPFRDGRAAERMGDFLKWLIEPFERGASRRDALSEAAERYANEWGRDKILSNSAGTG
jgi:hypothetical protein